MLDMCLFYTFMSHGFLSCWRLYVSISTTQHCYQHVAVLLFLYRTMHVHFTRGGPSFQPHLYKYWKHCTKWTHIYFYLFLFLQFLLIYNWHMSLYMFKVYCIIIWLTMEVWWALCHKDAKYKTRKKTYFCCDEDSRFTLNVQM